MLRYLIAVITGELLCETLPKLAHLAITPYGVRVLSGLGIKIILCVNHRPSGAAALYQVPRQTKTPILCVLCGNTNEPSRGGANVFIW